MRNAPAGIRTIATFEAAKGVVVLLAGSGILLLVHRDVQALAEQLVTHLHLDPAKHYPRIFLHAATTATPGRLHLLAAGALVYSIVRISEAVGLWHDRRWAEWLGVLSGAFYVPFEVAALAHRGGLEPLVALALNLGIVVYLGHRLRAAQAHALEP